MQLTNKNTFSTQHVVQRYNISERGLRQNLTRHTDELIENIHYFKAYEQTNGGKQEILKWTLRGIIKLGMFIRSKEAKNFRLWAEQELEKSINAELENARLTRERNLALTDKISTLEATAI